MDQNKLIEKKIDRHKGLVEYYCEKIDEVEKRIQNGASQGADDPDNEYHNLFLSLLEEKKKLETSRDTEENIVYNLEKTTP